MNVLGKNALLLLAHFQEIWEKRRRRSTELKRNCEPYWRARGEDEGGKKKERGEGSTVI